MGIFNKIMVGFEWTKCAVRVSKAFKKEGIIDKNENKKIIDFFSNVEFLRHQWTKILDLKTDREKLALFSIVYYLLKIQLDGNPFYWAKNQKEMDSEEEIKYFGKVTDMLEMPLNIYKNFIVEEFLGKNNQNAELIFKKHLNHLYKIDFFNFLLFKGDYFTEELTNNMIKERIDLINRYLLVFFNSDLLDEIEIIKDINNGTINTQELINKIDEVIVMTPNLGYQFDKIQFKLYALSNFVNYSLRKCFENNDMLSLSKCFNYLK